MDTLTHMLVGACCSQLPNKLYKKNTLTQSQQVFVGATTALFPDIDYLLFYVNPIDFLAYWHRAETHSLLLAPLWAVLLTFIFTLIPKFKNFKKETFLISLFAIISHCLIDSVTAYGTQWFAPFSDYRVSWNLLFVVDAYFTLTIFLLLVALVKLENNKRWFAAILPLAYLSGVGAVKYNVESDIEANLQMFSINHDKSDFELLPQPFSPFYWHVITQDKNQIQHAYVKFSEDIFVNIPAYIFNKPDYIKAFSKVDSSSWNRMPLNFKFSDNNMETNQAWSSNLMSSFRDFAVFPVLWEQNESGDEACVWFSDLRYHWPDFQPSFRYGVCRNKITNEESLYRKKYLSETKILVSHNQEK